MSHVHFCDVIGHEYECDDANCTCICGVAMEEGGHSGCPVELKACPEHLNQQNLPNVQQSGGVPLSLPSDFGVGIFWLHNGRLLMDAVPLSEAERYADALTYPAGHIEYWATLQEQGVVPIDVEYDEVPRGRVGYDINRERFLMFADQCIIDNAGTVKAIISTLHLPPDTEPMTDLQYRCPECLKRGRHREED